MSGGSEVARGQAPSSRGDSSPALHRCLLPSPAGGGASIPSPSPSTTKSPFMPEVPLVTHVRQETHLQTQHITHILLKVATLELFEVDQALPKSSCPRGAAPIVSAAQR